jgi:hypothetical protein
LAIVGRAGGCKWFSGTDDPELAVVGASEELLVVEGFYFIEGPHTFEDRSRRRLQTSDMASDIAAVFVIVNGLIM